MRDTRRTRIVLALLLLTAFTFITLDARGGDESLLDRARSSSQSFLGPIERSAAAVVRPVADFLDGLTSINSNQQRIDDLEAENDTLRRELSTDEYDQSRIEELDDLLRVAGLGRYEILPAQVIAVGSDTSFTHALTIDAGTGDGLALDMTVLNGDGLVGRVIGVSSSTATILLISDPSFSVGARLAGSLETGYVTGRADRPLSLTLFNGQAAVTKGDLLVTLGSRGGKPFVPGVPIGEVTSLQSTPGALTRSATVVPFANLTALDLVGVVVEPPRDDPRDSVLPPAPTQSTPPATGPTMPSPSQSSSSAPQPSSSP